MGSICGEDLGKMVASLLHQCADLDFAA